MNHDITISGFTKHALISIDAYALINVDTWYMRNLVQLLEQLLTSSLALISSHWNLATS